MALPIHGFDVGEFWIDSQFLAHLRKDKTQYQDQDQGCSSLARWVACLNTSRLSHCGGVFVDPCQDQPEDFRVEIPRGGDTHIGVSEPAGHSGSFPSELKIEAPAKPDAKHVPF